MPDFTHCMWFEQNCTPSFSTLCFTLCKHCSCCALLTGEGTDGTKWEGFQLTCVPNLGFTGGGSRNCDMRDDPAPAAAAPSSYLRFDAWVAICRKSGKIQHACAFCDLVKGGPIFSHLG